ncbi:hypothetical protein [Mangrovimonas aestuarii]|uniref:hypothetical protein n=1 Tax=Mangrovimonas aestuarii TaxID=3018443 RepID=UPI002378D00C|nr:hypothetical protein [Mangrovimonas aestuarii]
MKSSLLYIFVIIVGLSVQSCLYFNNNNEDDQFLTEPETYHYEPITISRETLENSTTLEALSKPMVNTGKIYVKGNLIFINENSEGFHIIDNSTPSAPQNIAFLNILGSSDLAIKNNVIFANNATDLIALSLNLETQQIEITKRIPNAFPQMPSPDGFIPYDLEEDEIILDWTLNE